VYNNPINNTDPTGHRPCDGEFGCSAEPQQKSKPTKPSTNTNTPGGSNTTPAGAQNAGDTGGNDKGNGGTPDAPQLFIIVPYNPAVSLPEAIDLFNDMADDKNIAFRYPNDGCYARSYLMIQRMMRLGVPASVIGRVYNEGSLRVNTPYDFEGKGYVEWGWHVAPALQVIQNDGSITKMVIDPSLFDKPVSVDSWRAIQNDPNSIASFRGPSEPLYPGGGVYNPYGPDPVDIDYHARATMAMYILWEDFTLTRLSLSGSIP